MWGNKKLRLGYETDLNPQIKNPANVELFYRNEGMKM